MMPTEMAPSIGEGLLSFPVTHFNDSFRFDLLERLIERLLPCGITDTRRVLSTPVYRQQEFWLLQHAGFLGLSSPKAKTS
jgi:hypothetical protein